jgi:hypothetical protein
VADLGQHPLSARGQPGQVEGVRTMAEQELQIVQLGLERLRRRSGRAAAQPRQPGDPQLGIDVQQRVQPPRPR